MHVTLRRADNLPSLRNPEIYVAVRESIRLAQRRDFRILHYSVQRDHIHLIIEAENRRVLSRGMQGLAIRCAKAVNRLISHSGSVWDDRYHARELRTPREVRNAIVYVLRNSVKHGHLGDARRDWFSSGKWFTGWLAPLRDIGEDAPVVAAETWLAAVGWRRLGRVPPS
jgi:REP element-mobilizing transposase RayT